MTDEQIEHMVQRFLQWRLPDPWHPDNGVSFKPPFPDEPMKSRHWPIGTNLFDHTQATEMVKRMIEGLPAARRLRQPATDAGPSDEEIVSEVARRLKSCTDTRDILRHAIEATRDTSWFKPAPEVDEIGAWVERIMDSANLVTNDGYYEFDAEAIYTVLAEYAQALRKEHPTLEVPEEVQEAADTILAWSSIPIYAGIVARFIRQLSGETK